MSEKAKTVSSEAQPFMYAIQGPDGKAYMDEFCVCEDPDPLNDAVTCLNDDREGDGEYKVVPVYLTAQPAVQGISDEEMLRREIHNLKRHIADYCQPVAPVQEPVAWRQAEWGGDRWLYTDVQPTEELAWEALYAEPVAAQQDPSKWTVTHNGNSVSADTLFGAMKQAQSLRTDAEAQIAAKNLMRAVDEELAQEPVAAQPQEAIGEVRENCVYWFNQNPHAYPHGTKFYAEQPVQDKPQEAVQKILNAAGLVPVRDTGLVSRIQKARRSVGVIREADEAQAANQQKDTQPPSRFGSPEMQAMILQNLVAEAAPAVPDARAAFEAWWERKGKYMSKPKEKCFSAWTAALAAAPSASSVSADATDAERTG